MASLQKFLFAPLDYALPRRCAGCGTILDEGDFCAPCWRELNILPDTGCPLCNVPVDVHGNVCGQCLATPPRHNGVLAAVEYGDIARNLVLKLKYGRKQGMANVMAGMMARHAKRFPDALLVPVPLHRWRIWHRGFNQSLLLARQVSRLTGQSIAISAVHRARRTSPLGGLSRRDRAKEVRGAFAVHDAEHAVIKERHILLVDDVYTTGATANAVASALKRAGASAVHVLAWARVLKDG